MDLGQYRIILSAAPAGIVRCCLRSELIARKHAGSGGAGGGKAGGAVLKDHGMGGVHAKVGHGFQVALRVRLIVDHIFLGQDQVKPVSAVKVVQHFRCVLAASCGNHGQVMGGYR